jgi:phenylacetic acid degradation operon negative regulatory protein
LTISIDFCNFSVVSAATSKPSAKSLVLDLLSTLRRGAMPVRALLDAGVLFGIAEISVRVALTRLVAEGLVDRDERGHYRLGRGALAVRDRVGSWRRLDGRLRPWRGGWIGVLEGRQPARDGARRGARRRGGRALRLLGFRELERRLAVRPDNLEGGVERLRAELGALGLEAGTLVFELGGLDALTEARARSLWGAEALVAGYRKARRELERSQRRLARLPGPEAMVESFLVGGRALRQLALDPLLPEPIVPAGERDALVEAMRGYDALGRDCWADFMARHGAPHRAAPANTRAIARGGFA